ncbi:hypothetical protein PG996_004714 [Apiospora saccharicola]|uniref:Uncharacterized protein n=1 Tax=Apiospora saccharicola TaxID=335842 RepID=A0ABR1W8N7_9PEZI
MSQSNTTKMAEKLRICFSAGVYFGKGPAQQPSSEGQRAIIQVHPAPDFDSVSDCDSDCESVCTCLSDSDSDSWFQMKIEPEVSLSTPKCKDSDTDDGNGEQDGSVLEAVIHLAFVVSETELNGGAMGLTQDKPIQMRSIAHYHSEYELPEAIAKLKPAYFVPIYHTATESVLQGDEEPMSDTNLKMDMATKRIREKLEELVMEAKEGDVEYPGLGYGDMLLELANCLDDFTPAVYMESVWKALVRLRWLCIEYQIRNTPAPMVSVGVSP